jgi:two-component system cell cycle response regulator
MAGRILIVDDIATNRIVLKVKLTEARYEVLVAEDAATGLQLARSRLPDLVLMDGCLSGQGGVAALRQLREDPATARIPVIIMLGDGDPDLRLAALQAGADDVMTKPMDEPRMLARLRALLRSCGMTEEMRVRDAALGPIGMTEAPGSFARPGLVALVADKPGPAMHMRSALALHMTDSLVIRSRDTALGVPDDPGDRLEAGFHRGPRGLRTGQRPGKPPGSASPGRGRTGRRPLARQGLHPQRR